MSGMDIIEIRRQNLLLLIAEAGGRQKFLSKTGRTDAQISQLLTHGKGSRNIGNRLARALEQECGKPAGFMDTPHKHRITNEKKHEMIDRQLTTALYSEANAVEVWGDSDSYLGQYAFIPKLETEIAGGKLTVVTGDINKDNCHPISKSWIERKSLNSDSLFYVQALDDSMEPYLMEGDVAIVDISDTHIRDGQVYVIQYGDDTRARRLFKRFDGSIRIAPDNARHPEETVSGQDLDCIHIIGRVVWRGG